MNKKITLTVLVCIVVFVAVVILKQNTKSDQEVSQTLPSPTDTTPRLSPDKKSIVAGEQTLLRVDDDAIISFFKDPTTNMCDGANIDTTPTRKSFCTNKEAFGAAVRFSKIVVSPTKNVLGFVIETDELPDTVSGIFFSKNTTYKTHLLTNYYLGNDFISFSPTGARFVYREGCFEAACGFTIKETATLTTVQHFGNPEFEPNYTFIRWISNDAIEYSIGNESKETAL